MVVVAGQASLGDESGAGTGRWAAARARHGGIAGDLVFTAGHIAIRTAEPGKPLVNSYDDVPKEGRFLATGRSHPDSRDGPIAAQAWYIYNELQKLLAAGGMSFSDVVLSSVFLADLRDFAVFHRVHRHFFTDAKAALSVAGFDEVGHRGCRIEIELTALAHASKLARAEVAWSLPAPLLLPPQWKWGRLYSIPAW